MFYADHLPPHFHAEYGEHQGIVDINRLAIIAGDLPPRALGLVIEWASLHQNELRHFWKRAQNAEPLGKITPLN